ncbi:MAG: hypothetical protein E6I92_12420 [Chloroflexi bacterium]|nr:MAG: hypothetical protein E6I92_12420 [Chloroflexota bacterium]
MAIAVSVSNSVAGPSSAATTSRVGIRSSSVRTKSRSLIGVESTSIRSVYEMRCGLGMNPTRWPAARRIELK